MKAKNPKEGATVEIKIAKLDTFGNKIEREAMLIRIDNSKWADLDYVNKSAESLKKERRM